MTRRRAFASALLPLLVLAAPSGAGEPADRFEVHEWGTFTSVQGADGTGLEGLHHEEEALPEFVYDRAKLRACPLRAQGYKGLELPAEHATQKMETPVVYFHGRTPRRVRLRVDFVDGLITQWYPVSDTLGPPEGPAGAGRLDLRSVKRSFLAWDMDVLGAGAPMPPEVPDVGKGDPWAFARDVDASWVRTRPREGPTRAGPVEAERFLFYRGLGTFTLPFAATVTDAGTVAFRNDGRHAVRTVVAIEVDKGGKVGRHRVVTGVEPGTRAEDLLAGRPLGLWSTVGVSADLTKILVGEGLHLDEAQAMVKTWTRSWLGSDGTRVLYVVPRPAVDALLPLQVDPAPDRVVRVLLGRIECLPPARLAEVTAALATLHARSGADTPDAAAAAAARDRVLALSGRFLEPWLRRVVATTTDAGARTAAAGWLEQLRLEDEARAAATR